MKHLCLALSLIIIVSAHAELTMDNPSTNIVRISRNGELLLVTGEIDHGWIQHVYYKDKPILMRIGESRYKTQVFLENSPIKIAENDVDQDGHMDRMVLYECGPMHNTIHDLLHIRQDGRLEPFSEQELQDARGKGDFIMGGK